MSSSASSIARQKGNEFFRSAIGFASVVRIGRYQKALTCYHQALNRAVSDEERCSAYKNLAVTSYHLTLLFLEKCETEDSLFYFKECLTYGDLAISIGSIIMSDDWIWNIAEKLELLFASTFEYIMSLEQQLRVRLLHRFASVPSSVSQRTQMLKQLVFDYFHLSVIALEKGDHRESLRVLTELYTPLTKLEDVVNNKTCGDDALQGWIASMKEDTFKNRCISESLQKRLQGDHLFESAINDAEDLDITAIWQVIDFYSESIVLTRENDVEQEAISLTRIGVVYHRVLLQKTKAKEVLMRVLQLAQTLQPRNLNEEKWFKDASSIIDAYQQEQKRKERQEWEKNRKKYVIELGPQLDVLDKKFSNLSIQKSLVWLYTAHPPTHCTAKFKVDIKGISSAPGDSLKKLLAKAIVFYHPDKIDVVEHGMKYKVWSEEVVKNLTAKYETMKG